MRILFHSPAPWTPSGYGQQTALFLPRLRDLGHELVVSAVNQHLGSPLMWEGFEVYSSGQVPYGADVLPGYAADLKPDLLLTLTDSWSMDRDVIRDLPCQVACWTPVDTNDNPVTGNPDLGFMDKIFFASSGARPVAMSRHGERLLGAFSPLFVPHGVDTRTFAPPQDRAALRDLLHIPEGAFAAGICAMNKGLPSRKAFPEQMMGFAKFRQDHPDALLFLHTQATSPDGLNLVNIAQSLGILDACRFTAHHRMVTGQVGPEELAGWYGAMDVLLQATMAEGFGIPVIESMACGTPVIGTRCSALAELIPKPAGWLVAGLPFWNPTHRANWVLPDYREIARALENAHQHAAGKRSAAREHALRFDADKVTREFWAPALEELEAARQAPRPEGLAVEEGWLAAPPEDAPCVS